jgi:hypothetical protein
MKGSFCEELERVFGKLPKYNIKILLGDFNAKFKPTIGNESLHEISNDNGVRYIGEIIWVHQFIRFLHSSNTGERMGVQ